MKSYILTLLVMLPIDIVWLFAMKPVYDKWLSAYQRAFSLPAAFFVYLAISFGLWFLVISKHFGSQNYTAAAISAFVFGVCSYAVYDLTNLATLKNWSIPMTLVDILWGGIMCTATTLLVMFLSQNIKWLG